MLLPMAPEAPWESQARRAAAGPQASLAEWASLAHPPWEPVQALARLAQVSAAESPGWPVASQAWRAHRFAAVRWAGRSGSDRPGSVAAWFLPRDPKPHWRQAAHPACGCHG
jgi:hypothetical protein